MEKVWSWPVSTASLTRGSGGSMGTQHCQGPPDPGEDEWSAGDAGPDGTELGRGASWDRKVGVQRVISGPSED